jgi:quercetin dioxygenase-like cupin family protein
MTAMARRELTWRCSPSAAPARMRIDAAGVDTEDRLLIAELTMPPHWSGPPWHVHHDTDLGIYVLVGRAAVKVGPERRTLRAGGCLWLPRDVPHGFGNIGDRPVKVLLLASPAEPFGSLLTRSCDALHRRGGRVPSIELDRLAREHDITVLGPSFLPTPRSPDRQAVAGSAPGV